VKAAASSDPFLMKMGEESEPGLLSSFTTHYLESRRLTRRKDVEFEVREKARGSALVNSILRFI
jgi:hypothetical protein